MELILSGEVNYSKIFCLPSEKHSTLKWKNLLPWGANSFLFRVDPFSEGLCVQESKLEVNVWCCPQIFKGAQFKKKKKQCYHSYYLLLSVGHLLTRPSQEGVGSNRDTLGIFSTMFPKNNIGHVPLFPKSDLQNFHAHCFPKLKLVLFPCFLKRLMFPCSLKIWACSPKTLDSPFNVLYFNNISKQYLQLFCSYGVDAHSIGKNLSGV